MLPTTPTSRSITHAEASHFLWFQSATFMDPFLPSRNRGRRPSHKCLSPFPSSLARNVFRQGVVPLLPMMYRDSHACRSFASLYSHSVSGGGGRYPWELPSHALFGDPLAPNYLVTFYVYLPPYLLTLSYLPFCRPSPLGSPPTVSVGAYGC